jgi:hypothetical protein
MFHEIPDSVVVLKTKGGVYRQTTAFSHRGQVFAKYGGGFIRLKKALNGTTAPTVSWDEIELPFEIKFDDFGNMLDGSGG